MAGSIKKGHENPEESFWTQDDIFLLREHLPDFNIAFLNPAFRMDDLSDQFSVFGRDMLQVLSSQIVFVDARNRRGLGVGAEMMWAKINRIPVVTWAPKNSHYHKIKTTILNVEVNNFIHPFIESLSDKIVENLIEGAQWIVQTISNPDNAIKDADHIKSAIQYYIKTQFSHDIPMNQFFSADDMKSRIKDCNQV